MSAAKQFFEDVTFCKTANSIQIMLFNFTLLVVAFVLEYEQRAIIL